MADDDIFGSDDFFDSDDFDGFDLGDDLEETPDFSTFEETDLGLATDDDEILAMEFDEEEPGISRTFKLLIGAGIAIVFIIVIALILFAVLSGDELSAGEKTSTAVAIINSDNATAYSSTLTAIALAENATNTAVAHSEETATAVRIDQMTQEAQMTADAAASATADALAAATFAAQTATADAAANADAEATREAGRLFGIAIAEGNVPISNATIQLYQDDGDGVFSGGEMPVPTTPPTGADDTGSDTGGTGDTGDDTGSDAGDSDMGGTAESIVYGQLATGNLAAGETETWTFIGATGDVVIINAIASSPSMDLFLRLYGPDGIILTEDDNGSGSNDPMISNLLLPTNGEFTLEVSSITGSGSYTLSLSLGLDSPSTDEEGIEPTPEEIGANINTSKDGVILFAKADVAAESNGLMRQDPTATPPLTQDQLVDIVTTGTNGEFDFGSLAPGVYWLVIDYNSLSTDLQALIPPTAQLVFRVDVPVGGEFSINVVQPTVTPTIDGALSEFDQTATAFAARNTPVGTPLPTIDVSVMSLTPTDEFAGTIPPTTTPAMPDTGIFDEIGGGDSDLDGTGGLTVLAIAAAGLIAVVFIARKLRSA